MTADNSVAFVPSKLECMKLGGWFNGLMVVGGSGGFIGVCSIGHLKPFGDEGKHLYIMLWCVMSVTWNSRYYGMIIYIFSLFVIVYM